MSKRLRALQQSCIFPLLLISILALHACRPERPQPEPPAERPAEAVVPPSDTSAPMADTILMHDSVAQGVPGSSFGASGSTQGWKRTELVQGVQRFITAIDSGDRDMFWSSLSERSTRQIDRGQLGPRDEIWNAARQTLGNIEKRRITVIGGSPDSVALRIDGLRLIDSIRQEDPIIIHVLHEKGDWKVMYPGLLYPMHHLRK